MSFFEKSDLIFLKLSFLKAGLYCNAQTEDKELDQNGQVASTDSVLSIATEPW